MMPAHPNPHARQLPQEAIARLHEGNKIEAIKIVREAHGIQLKEAKDVVDAYVKTQPALQQVFAAKLALAKANFKRALLATVVLFVVYLLLVFAR